MTTKIIEFIGRPWIQRGWGNNAQTMYMTEGISPNDTRVNEISVTPEILEIVQQGIPGFPGAFFVTDMVWEDLRADSRRTTGR